MTAVGATTNFSRGNESASVQGHFNMGTHMVEQVHNLFKVPDAFHDSHSFFPLIRRSGSGVALVVL